MNNKLKSMLKISKLLFLLIVFLFLITDDTFCQIARWKFNNNGVSETGNYDATVVNASYSSSYKVEGTYSLNGTGGACYATASSIPYGNEFTIAGWFMCWNVQSDFRPLISNTTYSNPNGFIIAIDELNKEFKFRTGNGSSQIEAATSGGEWVNQSGSFIHFAIVVNKNTNTCQIYINGVDLTSTNTCYANFNTSGTLYMGRTSDGQPSYGYLDDIHIYNCRLTASQISAIKTSPFPAADCGSPPPNNPPTANAGPDQTVTDTDNNGSQSVTLNGSGSSDSDGTITSYIWREGGSQIASGVTPSVTLTVGVHTITLTVTDDDGATASDNVVINVNAGTQNNPPIANAGPEQTIIDTDNNGSQLVTLNGSGSSDSDGTIVSYVWKEGGSQIATGVTPVVTLAVGNHTITLTVTDDDGATDTDNVNIIINPPGTVGIYNVAKNKNVIDTYGNMTNDGAINDENLATFSYSAQTCPDIVELIIDLADDFYIEKSDGPDMEITFTGTSAYEVKISSNGNDYTNLARSGYSGNTFYFEVNGWVRKIKLVLTPTQNCTQYKVYEIVAWGKDQPTSFGYFSRIGIGTTDLSEHLNVNGNITSTGDIECTNITTTNNINGNLASFNGFMDRQNPAYYLDPNTAGISLKVAGNIVSEKKIECEEFEVKEIVSNIIKTDEIKTNSLNVKVENVADYVFADDYKLLPIEEVENYIAEFRHLPDIPLAEVLENEGMDVAEMNNLLLKKIEELTLYIIEMKKENDAICQEIEILKR